MAATRQLSVQFVDDRPESGEQQHGQLEAVGARLSGRSVS
jgi:hypothetical protein